MSTKVDLVWMGRQGQEPLWGLGTVWAIEPTLQAVCALLEQQLKTSESDAWLFWDETLGSPDAKVMQEVLRLPGDVWHAGLRLGMQGLPNVIDYVHPTWMLNRDPDSDIEATSWRLSLRACLIRTEVLRKAGGPDPEYLSLASAALDMGYRYVTRGVLTRHVPRLLSAVPGGNQVDIPLADELRFARTRFAPFWSRWALLRGVLSGEIPFFRGITAWRRLQGLEPTLLPAPFLADMPDAAQPEAEPVTVLIPTIDRYPYLRVLLSQLRTQTVRPHEIVVIDQTPAARRDHSLVGDYPDLPLRVIYLHRAGQCSSRNIGLAAATGEYILFLDDDVEMGPTLIADHLRTLRGHKADVVSAVSDEVGAGPLPPEFEIMRVSDVFPSTHTLISRKALEKSGLFDLAYDRGQRSDGDLGMRVYLSGHVMVLDPRIRLLHHHAQRGGLRIHKTRVVTYASSRQSVMQRHLPTVTEIYLARRYFTHRQMREMLWHRVMGTLALRGGLGRRLGKAVLGVALLPNTLWHVWQRYREASRILPRIPCLERRTTPPDDLVHGQRGRDVAAVIGIK